MLGSWHHGQVPFLLSNRLYKWTDALRVAGNIISWIFTNLPEHYLACAGSTLSVQSSPVDLAVFSLLTPLDKINIDEMTQYSGNTTKHNNHNKITNYNKTTFLLAANFGGLRGCIFGNVRDKTSNITWRYATPCLPVVDCKINDLEWPWVQISRKNPFLTCKAVMRYLCVS